MVLAWHTLPSVRRQSRFLNNSPRRLFGEGVSRGEEVWGGEEGGQEMEEEEKESLAVNVSFGTRLADQGAANILTFCSG